jgi:hypothetical protein
VLFPAFPTKTQPRKLAQAQKLAFLRPAVRANFRHFQCLRLSALLGFVERQRDAVVAEEKVRR